MMHPIYRYRDDDYRFPESRRPEGQEASSASRPIERRRRRQQSADAPYQEERPRSAYYTPLEGDRREVPANPYAPPPQQRRERPMQQGSVQPMREARQPESFFAQDGSEYEAPAMPQLPEWYRIARQNAGPVDERRRSTPVVRTATVFEPEEAEVERDVLGRPLRRNAPARVNMPSSKEDFYERAGYPPELVMEQRRLSEEEALLQNRRRHGAQQAAPALREEPPQPSPALPRRRPLTEAEQQRRQELVQRYQAGYEDYTPRERRDYTQAPQPTYHPARQETPYRETAVQNGYAYDRREGSPMRAKDYEDYNAYEEYYEEETEVSPMKILKTVLAVAICAAAIAAALLFAFKVRYTEETTRILQDRQKAEERILQQHPIEYMEWIEREAKKNNLHPAFVAALIMNESSYRPRVESNVGARGLMQVMEPTAADIAEELGIENYSFDMLFDPETNIIFGCYYLGQLSQRFRGDPVCVSAAYHAGAQQVQNWLNTSRLSSDGITLKLENMEDGPTKQYATRLTRDFAIYQRLYFSDWEGRE